MKNNMKTSFNSRLSAMKLPFAVLYQMQIMSFSIASSALLFQVRRNIVKGI